MFEVVNVLYINFFFAEMCTGSLETAAIQKISEDKSEVDQFYQPLGPWQGILNLYFP